MRSPSNIPLAFGTLIGSGSGTWRGLIPAKGLRGGGSDAGQREAGDTVGGDHSAVFASASSPRAIVAASDAHATPAMFVRLLHDR
jgi:hypothetical protein